MTTANSELASIGNDYNALLSKYKLFIMQWNELKQQPEIVEAIERIEKRKKQEAEERKRQEAECKRDEQTRQSRFQSVLIRFINEGHSSLGKFSQTERINFNDKEANAIYYGLIATAVNDRLSLNVSKNIEASVNKFLAGMTWNRCTEFRRECVSNWTKLFATKDVTYTKDAISNFLSFVDHMSCSCRHIRLAWRLKRMR